MIGGSLRRVRLDEHHLLCAVALGFVWYLDRAPAINDFDLIGYAGERLANLKGGPRLSNGRFDSSITYTVIAQFWVTMAWSFLGGYLALILASRRTSQSS